MKQTISKITRAVIPIATFMLVITSCQKTQTTPEISNLSEPGAMLAATACSRDIPSILQVPAGNKLASQAYAKGVQIYQVQRSVTNPTIFTWVLIAPSATLYANADYTCKVAIHYKGPTWEFTKGFNNGEKTVGKKLQEATVDAKAIPWLLLQTVDSLSSVYNKVTYIQRVYTHGGLAPATGADEKHLGKLDSIPYTAVYRFYEKKN
jgi:hypothetical protein